MPNDVIRVNYEQLGEVAQRWESCADAGEAIIKRVQAALDPVRESWVGEASEAFFREMDGFSPRLQRLVQAFHMARQVTGQIQALFEQAEEQGAHLFNDAPAEEAAADQAPASETPAPSAAPPSVTTIPYTIQPGDTLWDLARRYNTTVAELARINNIANPDLIYAGHQLLIPQAGSPAPAPTPPAVADGPRSPGEYAAKIDSFNVASNPRYAKLHDNNPNTYDTYCNLFASDVAKSLGAELPIYVRNNSGETRWLGATAMTSWLEGSLSVPGGYSGPQGPQHGWKPVDHATAAALASKGYVVVAAGSGHMAVVRPGTPVGAGVGDVRIAQAGERNFNDGRMVDGWGSKLGEARFFVHQPTT